MIFACFMLDKPFAPSRAAIGQPFVINFSIAIIFEELLLCTLTTIDENTMKRKSVHLDQIRLYN